MAVVKKFFKALVITVVAQIPAAIEHVLSQDACVCNSRNAMVERHKAKGQLQDILRNFGKRRPSDGCADNLVRVIENTIYACVQPTRDRVGEFRELYDVIADFAEVDFSCIADSSVRSKCTASLTCLLFDEMLAVKREMAQGERGLWCTREACELFKCIYCVYDRLPILEIEEQIRCSEKLLSAMNALLEIEVNDTEVLQGYVSALLAAVRMLQSAQRFIAGGSIRCAQAKAISKCVFIASGLTGGAGSVALHKLYEARVHTRTLVCSDWDVLNTRVKQSLMPVSIQNRGVADWIARSRYSSRLRCARDLYGWLWFKLETTVLSESKALVLSYLIPYHDPKVVQELFQLRLCAGSVHRCRDVIQKCARLNPVCIAGAWRNQLE